MNARHLLTASVISVQNSNFVYPSCQNCFSRLLLDLKRYSCLKCGCSGDPREANYRYRLSLEVADSRDIFEVTVFGSCLDTFFGVTAKGLQRYIEELKQEAREPDRDAVPGVVFQAVETCFLGKKFVFGVKDSDKQDGTGSMQNSCRIDKNSSALTACQMFVPNSGLVGCTVIQYLQELQCSYPKCSHGGFWSPDHFAAVDQPSREFSGLYGSGTLGAVPSCCIDVLSSLWPQSFGLNSSSVSSGTTADLVALSTSKAAQDEPNSDDSPISLHSLSVFKPQDRNLTVNTKKEQKDKKCHLHHRTEKSEAGYSSLRRKVCRSLLSPLILEDRDSPLRKISTQCSDGLEKSWTSLPPQTYDGSLPPLAPSSSHIRASGNSQEDPWLWDELPSSESFNEFIAKIENDKATVLPTEAGVLEHFPSQGADEFHGPFKQSSPKPGICSANFITEESGEKLKKLAGKMEMCKEDNFPCHQLNLPCFSSNRYHQEASYTSLPTEEKENWGCWATQHPDLSPWSTLTGIKCSHSKGSCLSSKEGVGQDVSSCKSLNSCSSTNNSLKSPCLQTRKTTHLNCKGDGNLGKWENKGSVNDQLNQMADLINTQEQGFTQATCEKTDKVCEKERELFSEVQNYNFSEAEVSGSDCPEGSYNASADLFDASTRQAEATVRMFNLAQAFSPQEGTLNKECIRSEATLSEQDASWNTSWHGLSLHKMFTTPHQKTSTPVAGSISEFEHSLASTPGFVPDSQSTPLSRPCRQVSLPRGRESILTKLPQNKLSWINARCKRPRPSLNFFLAKQLFSKFPQSRRSSDANSVSISASGPQQLSIKGSPAQRLSENDDEEWIPPSDKKWIRPIAFQNGKTLRSDANCQVAEKSPLSENKVRFVIPKSNVSLRKVEFIHKRQQLTETRFEDGPVPEDGVHLRQLMSESPGSMHNTADWSSELFM
ncbi:DNA damage-induced apoptosis suppressor protein isoform X1 [Lacerta agilis]|uniref:DNA damage-induced apoptosis suppressor protein isoform X1 n=1 Tax=Lacerta agilis TaxID=80427 RepID=UPI0014195978|nr:DNA damage-induced apoptosis suppressor protein isoform X1 [Lacerta agilis]XP_033001923.1 DNA damage-induced apoptosis suppressor protein isoform X1 [Lacerta agilis]XP_033001924.1 DNA damage-induced apoptosis suppressor protein isoform X1 [Lacerta agilis]